MSRCKSHLILETPFCKAICTREYLSRFSLSRFQRRQVNNNEFAMIRQMVHTNVYRKGFYLCNGGKSSLSLTRFIDPNTYTPLIREQYPISRNHYNPFCSRIYTSYSMYNTTCVYYMCVRIYLLSDVSLSRLLNVSVQRVYILRVYHILMFGVSFAGLFV